MNRVNKTNWKCIISSSATLKETFTAKYGVLPRTPLPKRVQNLKFIPLSETTSIPATFIWECPPPSPGGNNPCTSFSVIVLPKQRSRESVIQDSVGVRSFEMIRIGISDPKSLGSCRSDETMNLLWISCQWNLDSGFLSLAAFWNPWPEFLILKPRIPDFTRVSFRARSPDSTHKNFRDDARITFHEAVGSV